MAELQTRLMEKKRTACDVGRRAGLFVCRSLLPFPVESDERAAWAGGGTSREWNRSHPAEAAPWRGGSAEKNSDLPLIERHPQVAPGQPGRVSSPLLDPTSVHCANMGLPKNRRTADSHGTFINDGRVLARGCWWGPLPRPCGAPVLRCTYTIKMIGSSQPREGYRARISLRIRPSTALGPGRPNRNRAVGAVSVIRTRESTRPDRTRGPTQIHGIVEFSGVLSR